MQDISIEKIQSVDQLIVRVWKACNFKCNFCNVSANERNIKVKENINDIVRNFHYKFKYSKINSWWKILVTISGWEPSLFKKETIFALKYIKNFLTKRWIDYSFDIQTNASLIDYDFALKLKKNWVSAALVSFHMEDKNIFEKVIWLPYENIYKIIDGINNLHKVGISVATNTIMSNENKNNFFDTIKFIHKTFPFLEIYDIWCIQPHWDALNDLDSIYPRYENIWREYNKAIFYLKKNWKEVASHFVWLPPCYLMSIHDSVEVSKNIEFRKNFNFSEKYLINKINDKNKSQTKDCEKCLYNNVCSGIWKEYIGLQKLKPIKYIIDRNNNFDKNNFSYRLKNKNENLKKIYNGNFRQIIVSTSLWKEEEIYEILKNATKMWFYKVSLLVNSDFEIKKEIVYTWVSNIQCRRENISSETLNFIKNFSKKYSTQFQINLDFI